MDNTVNHNMVCRAIGNLLRLHAAFFYKVLGGLGQIAGLPDIIGCIKGRFFGIEVKTGTGKLSPKQARIRQWILDAGGIYLLVSTVEDVEGFFVREGLIPAPLFWE